MCIKIEYTNAIFKVAKCFDLESMYAVQCCAAHYDIHTDAHRDTYLRVYNHYYTLKRSDLWFSVASEITKLSCSDIVRAKLLRSIGWHADARFQVQWNEFHSSSYRLPR